jgi:glycosyltransferase involved in cell wall biosynthesis
MNYTTALRPNTIKRLESIGNAEILVGIPCLNNEKTIANVIKMVSDGLNKYYRDVRSVIFISDGGSTDDTRDIARELDLQPWQERIIQIYRGIAGKGSAFRAIFEAAVILEVKACMVVDSDLRSISPGWVKWLLDPVLENNFEFVSPIYNRYKYDGTITNNIVYNLTRAVFGKRVRQPIGGDFTFSRDLAKFYLEQPVWTSDIAKYGIDIWMTINAIAREVKICQSNLGVKIHDAKDPAASLGPMFVQVIGTLFELMGEYESQWKSITGSEPIPQFGCKELLEPEAIPINLNNLVKEFKVGFKQFKPFYQSVFSSEVYEELEKASLLETSSFVFNIEIWAMMLYELAAIYHHAIYHQWYSSRVRLISLMVPLYFGRVASFVNKTWDMNSSETEDFVEEQAEVFEKMKDYLLEKWSDVMEENYDLSAEK